MTVWQSAHRFVIEVYRLTRSFPKEELFALTSQVPRASVSVPSNIVEGFTRWGNAEKVRFYNIAEGSLHEADYQLYLAGDTKRLLAAFLKPIRPTEGR